MITNRIEIYFTHPGDGMHLYLQSGDENSRYLELKLKQWDGNAFVDLETTDCTATMVYSYNSGANTTGDIIANRQEDGTFLTLIPRDPLLQKGTVEAQLSLRKESEEKVTRSAVLIIDVLRSLPENAEYTEQAVTELTAVLARIDAAVAAAEGAAAATQAANDAAALATQAAADANTAADAADAAALAATQAAADADDAAGTANTAAQGADASAAAAAQAAADADDAAGAANTAAQGADASAAAAAQAASDADDAAGAANTAAGAANTAAGTANDAAAQAIASKASIKTVDTYADYATLQSSVPSPTPYTDYYGVGASEPFDIYVYTDSGWLNLGPIGGAGGVSAMPAASVEHLDRIVQYIGATDATYTNGYFYKCQSDGGSGYEWVVAAAGPYVRIDEAMTLTTAQKLTVLASIGAIGRLASLPAAEAAIEGLIVQYIGATDETYTNGYFYKCQSDGGSGYEWVLAAVGAYATAAQGAKADTALQPEDLNDDLIVNGDLRTPVNTRGFSGAVSADYCLDCWIGNGTITPVSGQYTTIASGSYLEQRMDYYYTKLLGKNITVSVMVGDAISHSTLTMPATETGTPATATIGDFTVTAGFTDYGSGNEKQIEGVSAQYVPYVKFTANTSVNLQRVRAEIGDRSTLKATDIVPYATRLSICRHYYTPVKARLMYSVSSGTNRYYAGNYNFPTVMRDTPEITITAAEAVNIGAVTITLVNYDETGISYVYFTHATVPTAGLTLSLIGYASAEL